MQALIVLAVLTGAGFASPTDQRNFVDVAEDGAGGYKLAYKTDDAYKSEQRHEDGTVSGAYSYVDPDGNLQSFKYTAGKQGLRPSAPGATQKLEAPISVLPQVVAARSHDYDVHELIKPIPVVAEVSHEVHADVPTSDLVILLTKSVQHRIPVLVSLSKPAPAVNLLRTTSPVAKDTQPDSYKFTLGR